MLQETSKFADSIDKMMRQTLNVDDEFDPEFEDFSQEPRETNDDDEKEEEIDGDIDENDGGHDEL